MWLQVSEGNRYWLSIHAQQFANCLSLGVTKWPSVLLYFQVGHRNSKAEDRFVCPTPSSILWCVGFLPVQLSWGGGSLLCKAALLSVPKTTRLHCQILPRCWCEVVWSMGLDWWGLGSKSLLNHKIHGDLAQVLDYPTSKGSFEDKMWLSGGRIYTPLNSLEKGNIQQCDPHMQTYALQHVTTENRDVHFLGMPSCASYVQDHVPNIFFLYKYFY